jgi:hypothetical protein
VTEYPAPVILACEIVTEAELAVTTTDFEALLPIVMFPKESELVLAVKDPMAATPEPESCSAATVTGTVVVGVMLPDAPPGVVGANFTLNETL